MSFFSIIIPTYNSQHTIRDVIKSILEQSFVDYEIIVVDGISRDNTIQIVDELKREWGKITWISEKDSGVYEAMNKGIRLSKGEWLYFLGSDDSLYDAETLQAVYEESKQNICSVLYGNVLIKGNTAWAKDGDIYDGKFDVPKLVQRNICHQSVFYKKMVFEEVGLYNENYKLCADWDFNLRCMSEYEFHYFNRIFAIYNGGGLTNNEVDKIFVKDKYRNISVYYKNKISESKFIDFRYDLRKVLFQGDSQLSVIAKLRLLFNLTRLQFKVWKNRWV